MKIQIISIFLLITLFANVLSQAKKPTNKIGEYTIVENELAKKYCLHQDMTTFHQAPPKHKPYDTFFSKKVAGLRSAVYDIMKEPNTQKSNAMMEIVMKHKMTFLSIFIIPILSFVISIICAPLLLFYKCVAALCCCSCKKKVKQYESKGDLFKKIVIISTLVLSAGLVGFVFVWSSKLSKTAESTNNLACTMSVILHDVQYGYVDSKLSFSGIGGVAYIVKNMKSEVIKLTTLPEIDTIINKKLQDQSSGFKSSVFNYISNFKSSTCKTCKPGSTADVKPGVVSTLPTVLNPETGEIDLLQKMGNTLNSVAVNLKSIASAGSSTGSAISTLTQIITTLDETQTSLESSKKKATDALNFEKFINMMRKYKFIITLSVLCIVLLNLAIMYITMVMKKCKVLNIAPNILMFSKCFLGGILSLVSLVLMVLAILLVNGCYYYDLFMDDKSLLKPVLSEPLFNVADTCLYGSGDATKLDFFKKFGDHSKIFDSITPFFDLGSLSSSFVTIDSITESVTLSGFKTQTLEKFKTFENVDVLSGDADFNSNLVNLNQKAHGIEAKDEYVLNELKCPSGFTKSTPTDLIDANKGSNYCIIVPTFPFTQIDARYSPKIEANSAYTAMKSCSTTYNQLVVSMINSLESGPLTKSRTYLTSLKSTESQIDAVSTKLGKTLDYLKSLSGDVSGLFDCRILRKELDIVRKSLCHHEIGFVTNFALMAYLLSLLGPLMSCLGLCICCQTRISSRDMDKLSFDDMTTDLNPDLGYDGLGSNRNSEQFESPN